MGWFQFEEHDGRPAERELGYRLHPDTWGKGYATEGAAALLRDAFARPGIARVYAHSLLDNPGSIRVMEKIGMTYVGPWSYRGLPGAEYEALAPSHPTRALNDRGPLPLGGPDRSWRPSQAAQRAKGCALRRRGCARWGVTQQWVRAGTVPERPGRTGALRGARCGWGAGSVDGTVRARARRGRIRTAGPEVAGGGAALERGEGDGQVDGAPDGLAP